MEKWRILWSSQVNYQKGLPRAWSKPEKASANHFRQLHVPLIPVQVRALSQRKTLISQTSSNIIIIYLGTPPYSLLDGLAQRLYYHLASCRHVCTALTNTKDK